jgi:cytosine/adenosine deaminase-related metal-dependent hydrolase
MKTLTCSLLTCVFLLCVAVRSLVGQDEILNGTVVTPTKVIPNGWIVIRKGRIESVRERRPVGGVLSALPVAKVDGIIFPGFVDLHNHPMYDVIPRWHPPKIFNDRYEWRGLEEYKKQISSPAGALQKTESTFCDADEYTEVKALIGGTTAFTGMGAMYGAAQPVPSCVVGLVRNLDWASGFYGAGVGHERIQNALGVTLRDMNETEAASLKQETLQKKIDLLLVHVGEGSPEDLESSVEFYALKGRGFLGPHTAIIHGTALTADNFREMHTAGTALVWSPRSNIELYGVTTNVAAALQEKVTVALAPDWSPTGSTNTLAELAYASRYSREHLNGALTDEQLFHMGTATPARIARIEELIGTIQAGRYADLFVLRGDSSQPFTSLATAKPQDVQLVLIGGVPTYGSEALLSAFKVKSETLEVCGEKMALNSASLRSGAFAEVHQRLQADLDRFGITLAPLAECER